MLRAASTTTDESQHREFDQLVLESFEIILCGHLLSER